MKTTHKPFLIIILVIPLLSNIIILGSSPTTTIEYKMNVISYTPSGPIDIDGNQDFNQTAEAENWPGNGTEGRKSLYHFKTEYLFDLTKPNRYLLDSKWYFKNDEEYQKGNANS